MVNENRLTDMLMSEYYNPEPYRNFTATASANINKLTRRRVKDLMSQYATTGLGRSGISGAGLSDVYSTAGQNLTDVAAQGATMEAQNRQNIINQLLGLYKFQKQYELETPGFGDVLGSIGGGLAGSFLGPIGTGVGSKIGSKLADLI